MAVPRCRRWRDSFTSLRCARSTFHPAYLHLTLQLLPCGAIPGINGKSAMHHSSVANDVRCCAMSSQALARTSAASGSTFGRTADAAAANVTTALGLLLQQKLTLPCAPNAPHPGALCYDRVFGMITTARALQVSRGQPWVIRGMPAGCDTCLRRHLTKFEFCSVL